MIIVTQELFNQNKNIKHDIVADISSLEKLKKELSQFPQKTAIKIYDLGFIEKELKETVEVKDHLNKTGINPIIGSNEIDFKDISGLYKSKKGIITTCCGKKLNLNHKNPSHFLCVFSVLIFYLGFSNISGFIIKSN